MDQKKIVYI